MSAPLFRVPPLPAYTCPALPPCCLPLPSSSPGAGGGTRIPSCVGSGSSLTDYVPNWEHLKVKNVANNNWVVPSSTNPVYKYCRGGVLGASPPPFALAPPVAGHHMACPAALQRAEPPLQAGILVPELTAAVLNPPPPSPPEFTYCILVGGPYTVW